MTLVRAYPSHVDSNPGVWTNPNNSLNVENGVCATNTITAMGSYLCYVDQFKDINGNAINIPVNATITKVTVGIKAAVQDSNNDDTQFTWQFGLITFSVGSIVAGVCADSAFVSNSITSPPSTMPTPAQCNNIAGHSGDSYAFFQFDHFINASRSGYVDAVYVEITYTVPAGGVMLRRLLVGVGLILKRGFPEKLLKPRLLPNG